MKDQVERLCINRHPHLNFLSLFSCMSMAHGMGEGDWDTPRLPIFSSPRQNSPEPPGMLTPPLHPRAAVAFQWEEAPGRPRPWLARSPYRPPVITESVKRCLDLPPRLLSDGQGTLTSAANSRTIPSPTSVLEGPCPYYRKRLLKTRSFRQVGSGMKTASGFMRWAGFGSCSGIPLHDGKKVETPGGKDRPVASGILLHELACCDCDQEETNSDTKVKITGVKRSRWRGFLSLSPTKSRLWAGIYQGFKQVAQRTTQDKKPKTFS